MGVRRPVLTLGADLDVLGAAEGVAVPFLAPEDLESDLCAVPTAVLVPEPVLLLVLVPAAAGAEAAAEAETESLATGAAPSALVPSPL